MGSLDVLLIFGTALVSMLVSELVSWFFVYRTDKYARAVARTRKLAAELRDGETGPKRAAAVRAELKLLGGDTTGSNFKTMAFLGVIHWLTYSLLSRQYAGLVVARLPFEPLGLVQGMSHRGLVGQDHTEASFMIIFIMATTLRSTVQRLLGFERPDNPVTNSWGMPDDSSK